jgi:hypothetical protein
MREWLVGLTDIGKCSDKPITRSGIKWWIEEGLYYVLHLYDIDNDAHTTVKLEKYEYTFLSNVLLECENRTLDNIIEKLNTPIKCK